jgi:methyl coenzyme M reductase gamma subunit
MQDLFSDLVVQKVYTRKHIEQLEAVRHKLAEVKAAAPAVKEAVSSVQAQQGKRIRANIQNFTDEVNKHARDFRKISFLQSATGIEASYVAIDAEVCHNLEGQFHL